MPVLPGFSIGGEDFGPVHSFTFNYAGMPPGSFAWPDGKPDLLRGQRTITGKLSFRPNTLVMGARVYLRLARGHMPKRKWRRLRGRMKAEARRWRAMPLHRRLALQINRQLADDGVPIGDWRGVSDVVREVAPGWDFADATAMGDPAPRVVLTTFESEDPL